MNNRKFELIPGVENCAGEMKVAFPIEEYQNRLTRTRMLMEKEGIDLIYATAPESMNYITAVSYTHLDVYKRQGRNNGSQFCCSSNVCAIYQGQL